MVGAALVAVMSNTVVPLQKATSAATGCRSSPGDFLDGHLTYSEANQDLQNG
jgi:hypothetical protein